MLRRTTRFPCVHLVQTWSGGNGAAHLQRFTTIPIVFRLIGHDVVSHRVDDENFGIQPRIRPGWTTR